MKASLRSMMIGCCVGFSDDAFIHGWESSNLKCKLPLKRGHKDQMNVDLSDKDLLRLHINIVRFDEREKIKQ